MIPEDSLWQESRAGLQLKTVARGLNCSVSLPFGYPVSCSGIPALNAPNDLVGYPARVPLWNADLKPFLHSPKQSWWLYFCVAKGYRAVRA